MHYCQSGKGYTFIENNREVSRKKSEDIYVSLGNRLYFYHKVKMGRF
jgi:hypothetical protein